jgi:hypothetical protein
MAANPRNQKQTEEISANLRPYVHGNYTRLQYKGALLGNGLQ